MKDYQLVVALETTAVGEIQEKLPRLLTELGISMLSPVEDLKERPTAYPLAGRDSAHYLCYFIQGAAPSIKSLEQALKAELGILRYLLIAVSVKQKRETHRAKLQEERKREREQKEVAEREAAGAEERGEL